jgi:cysteinyl-tRNA synthetase
MAKSEENFLTLENALIKRGIPPLAYRYAAFQTHYRKPMEYTDESIQAAQNGLEHLFNQVREVAKGGAGPAGAISAAFHEKFLEAINDDLNMPRAMAVIQEMLKSDMPSTEKHTTILDFDRVLGLSLDEVDKLQAIPPEVQKLVEARHQARASKDFAASDRLRDEIQALGYEVKDTREGMKVMPR